MPMRWLLAALVLAGAIVAGMAAGRLLPETPTPAMRFVASQPTIEWQLPLLSSGRADPESGWLDDELPRQERVEDGVRRLRLFRKWARATHSIHRTRFDRSDKRARLAGTKGEECSIWIFDPESVDAQWDFLVREQGIQSQYRVTFVRGSMVLGVRRTRRRVQPESDSARGVLLLRPIYLRPEPDATDGSPEEYEARIATDLGDMARNNEPQDLHYPIDEPGGRHPYSQGSANGRVLLMETTIDDTVIVIISVGSADGVAVGDEYRISRGAEFVGFATITRVYKAKSVGEFDTVNTGRGAPPLKGDRCYVR